MPKDQKKFFRTMAIVSLCIAALAFSVAVVAIAMKEYITAVAMLVVTGWQVSNFLRWKKNA